jgi:hypothetical protein
MRICSSKRLEIGIRQRHVQIGPSFVYSRLIVQARARSLSPASTWLQLLLIHPPLQPLHSPTIVRSLVAFID